MARFEIPHLRRTRNSAQLIVKGQPFLLLPAELQNSSLSSADYMKTIWGNLKKSNFNTILGSVSWEIIEPEEGQFDFSEVDKVILDARQHGMHLVLLWFGSYKNGMSSYVPRWVKKNTSRFPRVQIHDDNRCLKVIDVISPFSQAAWEADAAAFAALMKHIKDIDAAHSTVLMVQVENECGILGDSRDRSELANEAFRQPVPSELLDHLVGKQQLQPDFEKKWPGFREAVAREGTKTWQDVFGPGILADEMFMVHALSSYVGRVAAAGKQQYPLPLFTNVWLNTDDESILDLGGIPDGIGKQIVAGGGSKPGVYPSGGPCPHTLDIWKHCAPALDFISPDIYLQDYQWACERYRYDNQPLFIPEQPANGRGARRAWLAYGSYGALGCSPFGVDGIAASESEFRKPYGLLAKMSKHILAAQANRQEMFGFFFDPPGSNNTWVQVLGQFKLTVTRSFVFGKPSPGYGIIIHRGEGRFLLIGEGYEVTFDSHDGTAAYTGILDFTELIVDSDGGLSQGRKLNGDERRGGQFAIMPAEEPDYAGFPIHVTVPARTYVAECTAYIV